tara:strand:- start:2212 stop:2397 length:186 start_codon:yes stop_codon:yes gene_type:complete
MGSNDDLNTNYLEYVHVHLISVEVGIIRGGDLVVCIVVGFRVFSTYVVSTCGRIDWYVCNE